MKKTSNSKIHSTSTVRPHLSMSIIRLKRLIICFKQLTRLNKRRITFSKTLKRLILASSFRSKSREELIKHLLVLQVKRIISMMFETHDQALYWRSFLSSETRLIILSSLMMRNRTLKVKWKSRPNFWWKRQMRILLTE